MLVIKVDNVVLHVPVSHTTWLEHEGQHYPSEVLVPFAPAVWLASANYLSKSQS